MKQVWRNKVTAQDDIDTLWQSLDSNTGLPDSTRKVIEVPLMGSICWAHKLLLPGLFLPYLTAVYIPCPKDSEDLEDPVVKPQRGYHQIPGQWQIVSYKEMAKLSEKG